MPAHTGRHFHIGLQLDCMAVDGQEYGALLQVFVGAVQGQADVAFHVPEEHAVAAVLAEQRGQLAERTVDFAASGDGDALGITRL